MATSVAVPWRLTVSCVTALQSSGPSSQGVESMCVHKMGPKLYERVASACTTHVNELVDGLEGHTEDMAAFLQGVLQLWNDHCQQMVR